MLPTPPFLNPPRTEPLHPTIDPFLANPGEPHVFPEPGVDSFHRADGLHVELLSPATFFDQAVLSKDPSPLLKLTHDSIRSIGP